jgi:hypothetical protein
MVGEGRSSKVVKSGTFLYAGSVVCDIRIVREPIRFGTGDYEDDEDVREDQQVETFYIEYGSTTERGRFNAGGGCYASLAEAIAAVERAPGIGATVTWEAEGGA